MFQTENKFSQGLRNYGLDILLQKAKGEYFSWNDGDDFWIDENKLENQIALMKKESDLALSFHSVFHKVGNTLNKNYFPKLWEVIFI